VAAIIVGVVQLFVLIKSSGSTVATNALGDVATIVSAYVLAIVLLHAPLWRRTEASSELVMTVLTADLAFVFAMTAATTTATHYERALLGMAVIVHVANFFFGARHAWRVLQLGVLGYLGLIYLAMSRHARVDVLEEFWTLALCAAGVSLMIMQATGVRRRLRTVVSLFQSAEDGDFTPSYDVAADRPPDTVTRVGMAYNRVRDQLSSMVLTDPLTGCLNRRGFDQSLVREAARATRASGEFGLVALDLDHFKLVNDTYGHPAGDAVLREVGAMLLASGRGGDIVARVGGEEFALLLPDTGAAGAHLFAARLCERIRAHQFTIGPQNAPVKLTASVGVAVGAPRGEPNFAAVLWSRADSALYAAKHANRDCVRAWSEETEYSGEHAVIQSDLRSPASKR